MSFIASRSSAGRPVLTGAEHRTITVKTLCTAADSIGSIFLSLYLFHLGGFGAVALYNIAQFVVMTAAFPVAGYLLNRVQGRLLMQVGGCAAMLVYLLLLVLGPSAADYVLVIGLLRGVGGGLYWPAANLCELAVTRPESRNRFLGRAAFLGGVVSVLAPPLASGVFYVAQRFGADETGYYVLFGLLAACLAAMAHRARHLPTAPLLEFDLTSVGQGLRHAAWRRALAQSFTVGFWASIFPTFAAALLFVALKSETTVSLVAAGGAVASSIGALVGGRVLDRWPALQSVGAIAIAAGLAGFAFGNSLVAVICFIVLVRTFEPVSWNSMIKHRYDTIETTGLDQRRSYHLFVEGEIAMNAGRTLSFLLALPLLAADDPTSLVRQAVVVLALGPLITGLIQRRCAKQEKVTEPIVRTPTAQERFGLARDEVDAVVGVEVDVHSDAKSTPSRFIDARSAD